MEGEGGKAARKLWRWCVAGTKAVQCNLMHRLLPHPTHLPAGAHL